MSRLCSTVVMASIFAAGLIAPAAADPVKERQELMKSVVKSVKIAVPMAKGEASFDAEAAKAAMKTINEVPDKFVKLFPEGSGDDPETEASPKIWENMSDFVEKAEALKTASAETLEAAGKGQEAFKEAVFGSLVKTCKNCHDAYRIKKE